MTTLSKEDVVRIDNELLAMIQKHFPSLPLDDRYTDWKKWLCFARAVYSHGEQAARAGLVAENERLNNDLLDALDCKQGKGPTALAMVIAERDELLAENGRLRNELLNSLGDVIDAKESMSLLGVPRNIFPEMHKAMCQQLTATRTTLADMEKQRDYWIEDRNSLQFADDAKIAELSAALAAADARIKELTGE